MLQRDYLMRLITLFAESIRKSWHQAKVDDDPRAAADTLEEMIGQAADIDGALLLSLEPESIASVMQVSAVDPNVTGYIVKSLTLAADYLDAAGDEGIAALRRDQARAIADAYGIEMPSGQDVAAELEADDVESAERELPNRS